MPLGSVIRRGSVAGLGSLQDDLGRMAAAALSGDLLRRAPLAGHPEGFGVVLGGSAVTEDADVFSGCDLFVFRLGARGEQPEPWTWHTVRACQPPYRYALVGLRAFCGAAAAGRDEPLYLVRHGRILHDPGGAVQAAFAEAWEQARVRMPRLLSRRYRAFRQRRASLAWSLRRGQPLLVLDNLRLLLEHALCCGYHLAGEPVPPSKWLFRGGLRTEAGRALREPVLELLSSLGDLATLGGSLNLRHNRIYLQVGRVQEALERSIAAAGHPVPGLAALAAEDGDPGRPPRSLPRRPPAARRAGPV